MGLIESEDVAAVASALDNAHAREITRRYMDSEELVFSTWSEQVVQSIMTRLQNQGTVLAPKQSRDLGAQVYFAMQRAHLTTRYAMVRLWGRELGMVVNPETMEISLSPEEKKRLFFAGRLPDKYYEGISADEIKSNPQIKEAISLHKKFMAERELDKRLAANAMPREATSQFQNESGAADLITI